MLKKIYKNKYLAFLLGEIPSVSIKDIFKDKNTKQLHKNVLKVHMQGKNHYVGKTMHSEIKKFISLNSSINFYFWSDDENDLNVFMQNYFKKTEIYKIFINSTGIIRADIFRLCVLYIFGGIYLDHKSNMDTSLKKMDPNSSYLLLENNYGKKQKIANWFLAFPPKHEFLKYCIDEIVKRNQKLNLNDFSNYAEYVKNLSGPDMVTHCYIKNKHIVKNLIDHDSRQFNLNYLCRGSWVRSVISTHYSSNKYLNNFHINE